MGKHNRRRNRKARRAEGMDAATPVTASTDLQAISAPEPRNAPVRVTPQRFSRGIWADSNLGRDSPMMDLAPDMIGRLYATRQITSAQHDAARLFSEILDAWLVELALPGYRSCLAGGSGGYDGGDGNPEAARAHDRMKSKLGSVCYLYIRSELEKPADREPASLKMLRLALDKINT